MSTTNAGTLMNDLRRTLEQKAPEATVTDIKAAKKKSHYWANIGVTVKGAGENGADVFIGLPQGLPLDDMKPVEVRGNKQGWIDMAQTKNELLDILQKTAANLKPGERVIVPLEVELYRVSEPSQVAPAAGNSIAEALRKQLGITG